MVLTLAILESNAKGVNRFSYKSKGFKIEVDLSEPEPRIKCKRPCEPQPKFSKEYLTSLFENAMNRMDKLGRLDDFISLLDVIGKGTLDNNVAVHLCLDIGTFHRVKILSQMTYPKISMDWWLTVKIILKGKALQEKSNSRIVFSILSFRQTIRLPIILSPTS